MLDLHSWAAITGFAPQVCMCEGSWKWGVFLNFIAVGSAQSKKGIEWMSSAAIVELKAGVRNFLLNATDLFDSVLGCLLL